MILLMADGWLITWVQAGHDRKDRVVTILPDHYDVEDVTVVLRSMFLAGSHTIAEVLVDMRGEGVRPHVHQSRHTNDYIRLVIELGSDAMEARRVRGITVSQDANRYETIRWEEQMHNGEWREKSFKRSVVGHVTFDHV